MFQKGVYSPVFGIAAAFFTLVLAIPAAFGQQVGSGICATGKSGQYLRADGAPNHAWSYKVPGRHTVYVERCLFDELLSHFPGQMRARLYGGRPVSNSSDRPVRWRDSGGQEGIVLSPQARFQVASAILYVESNFRPNVNPSSAGAVGPFQVLPSTGRQMGYERVDIPPENLRAGLEYILYIEEQINRYCRVRPVHGRGQTHYQELIAASYHAGPGYLAKKRRGKRCSILSFPPLTQRMYVPRFRKALQYRYLPGYLQRTADTIARR